MTNSLLENTLARSGDLMASFARPPSMFTRQCERASGILHPCFFCEESGVHESAGALDFVRVRDKWHPTEITHMCIRTPSVSFPVFLVLLRIRGRIQYGGGECHRV